jgi:hypothetical protein
MWAFQSGKGSSGMSTRAPWSLFALAIVATISLAGCAADDTSGAPIVTAEAVQPTAPSTDATDIPFSLLVGAGTPVAQANFPSPGENGGGSFDVPANTSLVVIDAEWSCSSGPACELAIVVYDDDGDVVEAVESGGPVHIELTEPTEGEWGAYAFSSVQGSAIVQAEGIIRVAVTHT